MEAQGRGTRKGPTPGEGRDCPRRGSGRQRQSETLVPAGRAACHMAASWWLSRAPPPMTDRMGPGGRSREAGAKGTWPLCRRLLEPRASRALCWSRLLTVPDPCSLRASTGRGGAPSTHNPPRAPTQFCHPATTASTHHEAPRLKPQVLYFCCQKQR